MVSSTRSPARRKVDGPSRPAADPPGCRIVLPGGGKTVLFIARGRDRAGTRASLVEKGYSGFLRSFRAGALRLVLDEEGVARARLEPYLYVLHAGSRRGFLWQVLDLRQGVPSSLVLDPLEPGDLTVVARTPEGWPAPGIPVGMGFLEGTVLRRIAMEVSGTDNQGRLAATGWRECLALLLVLLDATPCLFPDFPHGPLSPLELAALPAAGSELILTVPPFGRLLVELVGPDPQVVASYRRCNLSCQSLVPGKAIAWWKVTVGVQGGVAVFPVVGTGMEVQLGFQAAGGRKGFVARVEGPEVAGSDCHRTVLLAPPKTKNILLVGRVLGHGGRRSGWTLVLEYVVEGKPAGRSVRSLMLEQDGRFRVKVGKAGTPVAVGRIEVGSRDGSSLAVVDYNDLLKPGVNEVGDFLLKPRGVLVSGRVVITQGKPAAGVMVLVFQKRPPERPGPDWLPCMDLQVRTDEKGAFRVKTIRKGLEFRVQAFKKGFSQVAEVFFHPGQRDVLVRLVENIVVQGVVDGLEPKLLGQIFFTCREIGAADTKGLTRTCLWGKREFRKELPPGLYEFRFYKEPDFTNPIHVIRDVHLVAGSRKHRLNLVIDDRRVK